MWTCQPQCSSSLLICSCKTLFRHAVFHRRCLCSLCCLVAFSAIQCPLTVVDPHWPKYLAIIPLGQKEQYTSRLDGHSGQKYFPFVSVPGLVRILWCYMIHMVFCSPPSITRSQLPVVQSFILCYYSCYGLCWRSLTAVGQMLGRSAKAFVAPSVIIAQFPSQESRIWKGGPGILSVLVDWLITNRTITGIRFQPRTDVFPQTKLVQTLSYLLYLVVHSPWLSEIGLKRELEEFTNCLVQTVTHMTHAGF